LAPTIRCSGKSVTGVAPTNTAGKVTANFTIAQKHWATALFF
jgi:hypothetical protein